MNIYYVVFGLIAFLSLISLLFLYTKTRFRGVLSLITVLLFSISSSILGLLYNFASDSSESYYLLVFSMLLMFAAVDSVFIFSRYLIGKENSKCLLTLYMLTFTQFALCTIPSFRNSFIVLVVLEDSNVVFKMGGVFYFNVFVTIVLGIYSTINIYKSLDKYKNMFLLSSTVILVLKIVNTILRLSFEIRVPTMINLLNFLLILNVIVFVYLLEKLYVDVSETKSDVLKYLNAYFIIVDEKGRTVDKMNGFNLNVINVHKFINFYELLNNSLEVDKNVYIINNKFFKLIHGGTYDNNKNQIYYLKDMTRYYIIRRDYYTKYLSCDLTGCKTRSNILQDYLNINDLIGNTVAFYDLDNFKKINDTYSHFAGDSLIINFSKYLVDKYGHSHVYRLSGDEFVIITKEFTKDEFITGKLPPISIQDDSLEVEYSVAALYVDCVKEYDVMYYISRVEEDMYKVKKAKKELR